jgi:hypothetical protein
MDIVTLQLILKAGKLSLDAIKKEAMVKQLNILIQKSDQLISREIKAAYEALDDALITSNIKTREIRLNFCEENLLKNTNLDPGLTTGGFSNKYWMALAHNGLAFVCTLREDSNLAAKHLIKIYECDPRLARQKLLPELYVQLFQPQCKNVFDWHEKELKSINESNFVPMNALVKTGAVAIAIGSIVAGFSLALNTRNGFSSSQNSFAGSRIAQGGFKIAEEVWKNSNNIESFRQDARNKLYKQLEDKLDERCQEIARSLLSE